MENSIEEDIKDLEKYIKFSSKHENFEHDTDWNWHKELGEKIKRVLKENEELKEGIIPSYEETISELEKQLFESIPAQKNKR